jgi:hypothetical protein
MRQTNPPNFLTLNLFALIVILTATRPVSASVLGDVARDQPTPTYVSTLIPVSGAPLASTPTPFNFPTAVPPEGPPSGPPLSLTLTLLFTCCGLGLVVGVLILGFVLAMQKRKGGSDP